MVIVFALIPATGQFAMIARLARLLRVVRLISAIRDLRLIVAALVRSIPERGPRDHADEHRGVHLRHHGLPPLPRARSRALGQPGNFASHPVQHHHAGRTGPTSWTLRCSDHSLAWVYFVSFVVVGTFVVINLFIAIIINSLDETKRGNLQEGTGAVSRQDLIRELRATEER